MIFEGVIKEAVSKLRNVPGVISVDQVADDKDNLHQLKSQLMGSQIYERICFIPCQQIHGPILEFRSMDPSLEEIFLRVTQNDVSKGR